MGTHGDGAQHTAGGRQIHTHGYTHIHLLPTDASLWVTPVLRVWASCQYRKLIQLNRSVRVLSEAYYIWQSEGYTVFMKYKLNKWIGKYIFFILYFKRKTSAILFYLLLKDPVLKYTVRTCGVSLDLNKINENLYL